MYHNHHLISLSNTLRRHYDRWCATNVWCRLFLALSEWSIENIFYKKYSFRRAAAVGVSFFSFLDHKKNRISFWRTKKNMSYIIYNMMILYIYIYIHTPAFCDTNTVCRDIIDAYSWCTNIILIFHRYQIRSSIHVCSTMILVSHIVIP